MVLAVGVSRQLIALPNRHAAHKRQSTGLTRGLPGSSSILHVSTRSQSIRAASDSTSTQRRGVSESTALVPVSPASLAAPRDSSLEFLEEQDSFSRYSGYIARSAGASGDEWDVYDAEAMGRYFQGRPFLVLRRLVQIGSVLGTWFGKRWVDGKLGKGEERFQERAGELRQALVQLGPAFVKIAQAVSSRPDVIPPQYLDQLALLQDRIAPFPTRDAIAIIEADMGVKVDAVFKEISAAPVAAASLGQVYQARLRSCGRRVAVKVQRPGVRAALALDIFILRGAADRLRAYRKINTDLQAVVDEWATSLFREIDYEREAQNGIKFGQLFGSVNNVVIPRMYPELTTQRVLVMEWIEGTRLVDSSDLRLVEVGVYCTLTQLLDSGFYHADPHPGNFLVTKEGKLAYLDFGMMGSMDRDIREAFIRAAVHLVNREWEQLAGDFVSLGLLPPDQEVGEVSDALTGVFRDAVSGGVRGISFGSLGVKLGQTMYRFKFRLPAYFSLIVRSLSVLEGIALKRNPDYKVIAAAYPFIAKKVLTDASPQLRSTVTGILFKDGRFRVSRLESLLKEIIYCLSLVQSSKPMNEDNSAPTTTTTSITTTSRSSTPSSSASSPLFTSVEDVSVSGKSRTLKRVLKFGLSEEGRFIRELLLDEVAKGLDALNRVTVDSSSSAIFDRLPGPLRAALPPPTQLATDEDLEHLDNLQRLATVVTGLDPLAGSDADTASGANGSGDVSGGVTWQGIRDAVSQASAVLQRLPSLDFFTELPLPARQTALLLPAELASRLVSRSMARGIRSNVRPSATAALGSPR